MDLKQQAKMDVLKQIRQIASDAMKDDMKMRGLKKVTVASNSEEGLEEALDKAKDMLEQSPINNPWHTFLLILEKILMLLYNDFQIAL